jgi:hypothetical protein
MEVGTSMAAPVVAGTLGFAERYKQLRRNVNPPAT